MPYLVFVSCTTVADQYWILTQSSLSTIFSVETRLDRVCMPDKVGGPLLSNLAYATRSKQLVSHITSRRGWGDGLGGVTGSFTEVKLYNPSFLLCSFFFLSLCLPTTKRTFRQLLLPITEVISRRFRVLLVLLEYLELLFKDVFKIETRLFEVILSSRSLLLSRRRLLRTRSSVLLKWGSPSLFAYSLSSLKKSEKTGVIFQLNLI
jgi:hypothetical protein